MVLFLTDDPGIVMLDYNAGVADLQSRKVRRPHASEHYNIGYDRAEKSWFDPEVYNNPQGRFSIFPD